MYEVAVAVLRDLRTGDARRLNRGTNGRHIGRRLELELHQRAARELDAVVRAARDGKRGQAGDDERDGEAGRDAPVLEELVLRV